MDLLYDHLARARASGAVFARTEATPPPRPPGGCGWGALSSNGELGLAKIANVIGYGSPYAFAAAFRRHHGDPPGAWRQRELTRTSSPVAGDRIHLR